MSGIFEWLHRKLRGHKAARQSFDEQEPQVNTWQDPGELVELRLSLPGDIRNSLDVAEQFLLSTAGCIKPIAFEFIGQPDAVVIQVTCAQSDADQVDRQLEAHFPKVVVTRSVGLLNREWAQAGEEETVIVEFGLGREFMLPLAVMSEAHNLYGRWPSLEREEKRRIVESITEKIVVSKDEIAVILCSLPSAEPTTNEQRRL